MDLDWIHKFFEGQQTLKEEAKQMLPLKCTLTGRVNHIRTCGKKMFFLILRSQEKTLQVIFREDKDNLPDLTRALMKEYSKITPESIVKITGKLIESPEPIKNATLKTLELVAESLELIVKSEVVPLQIYKPDGLLETRLQHRVLDLRAQQNQIIFQIQSQILNLTTQFFNDKGFLWLPFPKILGGTSESGSEAFKVDYFGKEAFLAQSPQLYKQMAINAGFRKVYTVGPVFRAENSHTSRHLTEFTGIDFEMEIEDRKTVLELAYNLIQTIFKEIKKNNSSRFSLWEALTEKPFDFPLIAENPVIIEYQKASYLLDEANVEVEFPEDFNNTDLLKLADLVKTHYYTDLFILDKFPIGSRAFYTQPDPEDSEQSLGYDLIFRGKEILSGAQRVSDYELLKEKMDAAGLQGTEGSLDDYLESFKYASHSHAGGGFGLERIMMAYFNLPNIRNFSVFPRDPSLLNP